MDKSYHSSVESTTTNTTSTASSGGGVGAATTNNHSNNRDQYLRHLNKISHRISKPAIRTTPVDPNLLLQHHPRPPPAPPQQPQPPPPTQNNLQPQQPPHQHQPPVYNINKSDFRDVVQKLTGSPAHDRFSTPPPIHPPKPQSSRLQRIRPPPLSAVGNRPPPPTLLNTAPPPPQSNNPSAAAAGNPNVPHGGGNFTSNFRQVAPLSPLPPFPSVHGAAESPISAYMRYLHGSISAADSDPKQFPRPLISPRWNNPAPPPQHQIPPPMPPSQFSMPTSPLPFGCVPSPRSPYPLLSPSLLFSPTAGPLGFPASPRLPVPNPRWRDL